MSPIKNAGILIEKSSSQQQWEGHAKMRDIRNRDYNMATWDEEFG